MVEATAPALPARAAAPRLTYCVRTRAWSLWQPPATTPSLPKTEEKRVKEEKEKEEEEKEEKEEREEEVWGGERRTSSSSHPPSVLPREQQAVMGKRAREPFECRRRR